MGEVRWHHVPDSELPDEGSVRTVIVDGHPVAMSRCDGTFGALDNHCPHQGGPLGEGAIENGWLRCPWHGYDYDPITGRPPAGFTDGPACYPVELRDGQAYVAIPERTRPERTVADVVVETLVAWGVTHVFGMVGHSNLGLADAIRRAEERGEITSIGIRHEGAAAFAASAFGKLTGRPAACLAIAGPGSTNLLTGLYDAKLDNAPVIALSGQVPSSVLGRGAFQDLDLTATFGDVAITSTTLASNSDHGELTALAVKRAIDGRGVTHLVLPDDVQIEASDRPVSGPTGRLVSTGNTPPAAEVQAAAELIAEARRPVLIVGDGARGARAEVTALAEMLHAPVLTTFRAKGLIPDQHESATGCLGRSGTPVASWFMNEADLLIVVGASSSNHTGIADYKPSVVINDHREHLGRFQTTTVPLQGDSAATIGALLEHLAAAPITAVDQLPEIAVRWAIWRGEKQRRASEDRGHGVSAAAVFAALSEQAPANAVICVDVGNNAYSFGRYFESKGQRVLMSGYLGSIGFGYPAAIGATAGASGVPIIAVTGDGGFAQYLAEVTTAVKYQLPIKHLLLDNGSLGKIAKEQLAADYPVWQTSLVNPDFAAFARMCGAAGQQVDSTEVLPSAMASWLATDGPATLVVRQDVSLV